MLFNSYIFCLVFLPMCFLGTLVFKKTNNHNLIVIWLVACSVAFYGYWDINYIYLIISSILFNFLIAKWIKQSHHSKIFLILGITVNLLFLAYYKYFNMLITSANALFALHFNFFDIVLPIGISFFTFEQIAYLVDTYRGQDLKYHFLDYCLFISFFPRLIAGPIIRHNEVLTQISSTFYKNINSENFAVGITIFLFGLFKKIVLANTFANISNDYFSNPGIYNMIGSWIGIIAFSLQIYFDFSAYSDMATGLSKMFGITLPINFNSPYKSLNVSEFWTRWNISLSRFLRDYLYIPLGGNRSGKSRRYINLMITMLLGGLWHGAAWTFVLWGFLHGLYLCVYHAWVHMNKRLQINFPKFIAIFLTFFFVTLAWIPFRAESYQQIVLIAQHLFTHATSGTFSTQNLNSVFLGLIWIFSLPSCLALFKQHRPVLESEKLATVRFNRLIWKPSLVYNAIVIMITVYTFAHMGVGKPFIYFDF